MLGRVALLAALSLAVPAVAAAQAVTDFYGPIGASPRAAEPAVPPRVEAATQAAAGAALPAGSSAWTPRRRAGDEARPDRAQLVLIPAKPPRPQAPAPTRPGAEGEPLSAEELDAL